VFDVDLIVEMVSFVFSTVMQPMSALKDVYTQYRQAQRNYWQENAK
jgi:hypothetical protein